MELCCRLAIPPESSAKKKLESLGVVMMNIRRHNELCLLFMAFLSIAMTFIRCRRHPSQSERFDLELPNFTKTSIPTYSTTTPNMTLLAASDRLQIG